MGRDEFALMEMSSVRRSELNNTPEEVARTMRVVCGARSTKDAADAQELLEALGLYPTREVK